jgi:uncharacterized protein
MPVRSLNSSVLRWPETDLVLRSLEKWAAEERRRHPLLMRLGYFGSYARGDAGVGSDLDLVAVVAESDAPFERRALDWDLSPLPIPSQILVYTSGEWRALMSAGNRFSRMMEREIVWI